MSNAETFLSTFASIERTLRAKTQSERTASFYQLVDAAARWSPEIRRYRDDLKEFADLRNAIIHERSDGHVIAEPNDGAVERLKVLEGMVLRPPAVLSLFQGSVLTISPSDSLARAVTVMRENGFSQAPVVEDTSFVGLLTSDCVARWLGAQVQDDVISLGEARVDDVLRFAESEDNYAFVGRTLSLVALLEEFAGFEERGERLDAVLITESGKQSEKLLGIVTIADLPRVLAALR